MSIRVLPVQYATSMWVVASGNPGVLIQSLSKSYLAFTVMVGSTIKRRTINRKVFFILLFKILKCLIRSKFACKN